MLSGLLRLELRFPTAVPCSNGESNHREFLRQLVTIDAEAAALMHGKNESTLRPFTISSLRGPHKRSSHVWLLSAGTFNVRLTALTSTAEVLVRSVFQYSREWQILGAQFAVTGFCDTPTESDWALTLTHDEFVSAAVFAATLRRDRILLRFHSPTAFARSLSPAGPTTIHFPEVLAIFGALRRKFVEHGDQTLLARDDAPILKNSTEMSPVMVHNVKPDSICTDSCTVEKVTCPAFESRSAKSAAM